MTKVLVKVMPRGLLRVLTSSSLSEIVCLGLMLLQSAGDVCAVGLITIQLYLAEMEIQQRERGRLENDFPQTDDTVKGPCCSPRFMDNLWL